MTDVVSSILGPLVEKLASPAVEEIQLVCGAKDDREKLKNTLKMIQEVLADAEQKQIKEAAVRHWLSELKDFCYDVEDVLDEFETRALWRQARLTERLTLKRKVCQLSSWLSNFIFQFKMAQKMKGLGKRLDGINEEKTKFNLSSNVQQKTIVRRRETYSFVPASNVIGRNKEKETMTELLMRSDDDDGAATIAVPPLNLTNLSPEESLALFVNHAFDQGQEQNHPDLMEIAEQIVSKCGGNPLAVRTLGSLLYSKSNRSDWEYVRDSEIWELQSDILPSLRISYDLMPSYLKQCFAYCSIFPKNHEFFDLDVIQLWISNGFIQSDGNGQEPEEIGRQYLEELLSRSFFDVVRDEYPFLSFRMPDLIYELAISVAQTESCNMKEWAQDISSMTRHISFPDPSRLSKDEVSGCLSKLSCVRTIWLEEGSSGEFFLETCISRFKHLRVLWLEKSRFDQLPSSIGGLKHLRFLNLCGNENIKKLPKSVCELLNLQCLDLSGCEKLEELPADIKNMISLSVLGITTKQQRLPEGGIGCLTYLRWLFIGGCEKLEALFDDIQSLTSLRKLFIVNCPKLASLPQGVKHLEALEDLWIVGCKSLRLPEGESNEPRSMSRLQSIGLLGLPQVDTIPGWLEGSAGTLQRIRIEHCPELSALPEWLQSCSSLRTLKIQNCPGLSSLPDGVRSIATLTELRISNCGELSSCGEEDDSG